MEIDLAAPVVARHEILIRAPLDLVWGLLADIGSWPRWNTRISRSRLKGDLVPGTAFVWRSGGTTIRSRLAQIEEKKKLVWTGRALGARAVHVWHLELTDAGVLVRTEESISGWLASLVRDNLKQTLDKTLQDWLKQLKRQAEAEAEELG